MTHAQRILGTVAILGAGVTGAAIAQMLRHHNVECCVIDSRSGMEFRSVIRMFNRLHVSYFFGGRLPDEPRIYTTQVRCCATTATLLPTATIITAIRLLTFFPDCPFASYALHIMGTPEGKIDATGFRVTRPTKGQRRGVQPAA